MKQIQLTQGKVALVDDVDYERLNQHRWCAKKSGATWYAVRMVGKDGKQMTLYMHREILGLTANIETDHKDGDGLNNQRHNLRLATTAQNQRNQKKQKGTSQYKGVYWYQGKTKWCAQIWIAKKRVSLGIFLSEIDAAKAYDNAAIKHFGEFARTNFQNVKEVA